MDRWNAENHADRYMNETWDLALDPQSYRFIDQDDRWFEKSYGGLGRTFPHKLEDKEEKALYSTLRYTPMVDQLTLSFVKAMVTGEKIGKTGQTDLLAVSLSATDYIGHAFGPYSLEAEDNLLRLDRTLQELFRFVDQAVGLDKTLVVLSSDHGISPAPEQMNEIGIQAGRLDPQQFMNRVNARLKDTFGTDENLALTFMKPGIYLDQEVIGRMGLDPTEVERAVAAEMMQVPGFTLALAKSDILAGRVPGTFTARSVVTSFHPERSGDVIVVQDPFWYLSSTPDGDTAMHGSPYHYDSHVPIMMAGPGIRREKISTRVAPRDVAPTICNYFGIASPSGSTGTALLAPRGESN
jgi:predicted AlkP superfamily pyrophosphatase or phosphodiesterase